MESITDKLARYIAMLLGNHMTRTQLIQIEHSLREKQKQAQEKKAREQRQLKQAREKQQTKQKRKKVAQHLKHELRRRAIQREKISKQELLTGASGKASDTKSWDDKESDIPVLNLNELTTINYAVTPKYKVKFKNDGDRTILDGYRKVLDSNDLQYITQIFNEQYTWLCDYNETTWTWEGRNVPSDKIEFFYIPNNMNNEDFNSDQRLFEIFRKHPDKFFIKINFPYAYFFKTGFLFPRSVFTDDSQPTLDHLFDDALARNKLVLRGDTLLKYDEEANTLSKIPAPIPDFIASADTDLGISRRNNVFRRNQQIPGQHLTGTHIPSTDDQNSAA
jgi:hypothetical protein